jgi:hypothetical protein
MGDLLVFRDEDGREIISSYDSSNNCSGAGLMAHIEARGRSNGDAKKAARDEAKAEQRRIHAEDIKVLGPLFGQLAQVIRCRQANAKKNPTATLKRDKRRRRRFFKD